MTKLRKIRVEGFRGARFPVDIDFTKRSMSMAIYGDNGGGKSTITDAIEWYYNNRIDHLWREDCKEECLRNTQFPDDENATVSVEFSKKDLSAEKNLTPTLRGKFSNTSEEFKAYLDQSGKERLFLRYGDILRFILFTKGEKRSQLLNIIGYQQVGEVRNTLVSACNDIERDPRFREVRNRLEDNEADLMKNIGRTITKKKELYEVANNLLRPLKPKIKVVDKKTFDASIEAIKTREDKERLEKRTRLSDFHTALDDMKKELGNTKDIDTFIETYTKLLKDKEKIKKIGLIELLEKGQKLIQDQITGIDVCPLCLSSIDSGEVLQQIGLRIRELEALSEEVENTEMQRNYALSNVRRINSALCDVEKKMIEDDPDFKNVSDKVAQLKTSIEQTSNDIEKKFQKLEIIEKDPELFERKFKEASKEVDKLTPKINEKISALSETEEKKLQFDILEKITSIRRIFEENKNLSKELELFEKQLETLTQIRDTFIQIQAKMLQDVLDAISGDVDTFYRTINPEEGVENIRLVLIGEEGVEFRYTFHGKESHPPLKYLSESHLNCLGICLFLASVKLFNKENKFFILDDVITSFDSDHRIPFMRLFQEHFSDYQVVLLTHEKFWYELINAEMKQFGWLFNDVSWSIEDGIQLQQSVVGIKDRGKVGDVGRF